MLISAPGLISGIRLGENANVVNTNCNISTTSSKFGASSIRNIGTTGAYANITPVTNFAFGNSNFTIEFWYQATSTAQQGILGFRPQGTNGAYMAIVANYPVANTMCCYINNGVRTQYTNAISQNNWINCAVVRFSGNTKMYINGVAGANVYLDSTNYLASRFIFASDDYSAGGTALNGYIDELRISNVARYTGNYTPATEPFIDDANTLILYHADQANGSRNFVDDNS